VINGSTYFEICSEWITEPSKETENIPLVCDIPILLMASYFDSITDPAWSEETANFLEKVYFYEFPNMAHGTVRYDTCAMKIALDFIDDPNLEPDACCLDDLDNPEFQ
jgi:hypothetical protein